MSGYFIQSRHGAQGNFELVTPTPAANGLDFWFRDNDNNMTWGGPWRLAPGRRYVGSTLIQSNYGETGNLEVLAVDTAGNLDFFWRLDHDPWTWSGPFTIAGGLRGTPCMVQSRFGSQGNFEVVVPHADGGLAFLFRDNDNNMTWGGPFRFGGGKRYNGATLIQSNYGRTGNLEVLAIDETGTMDFFWREDAAPFTWHGPFQIATGLRGTPSLIQSNFGDQGNFEVVAPHADGGLAFFWRDNDGGMNWQGLFRFGDAMMYDQVSLFQSNYGAGNFEVVAIDTAGNPDFFWRVGQTPWTWSGPFSLGREESFNVSECIYNWRAAYRQVGTHITARINLMPDPGVTPAMLNTLRNTWRTGIQNTWGNRFDCQGAGGDRQPFTFDIQWTNARPHHNVQVRVGPLGSNMTQWDTADTGNVAAHEFGHMLGHPDEYSSSLCPTRNPVNSGTVMDDNTQAEARYYNRIASNHFGHTPVAGPPEPSPPAPEGSIRLIDSLTPRLRSEILDRLRTYQEADAVHTGADAAVIAFEVTGGAPGEFYRYRIEVTAEGLASTALLDHAGAVSDTQRGRVDRALAARAFRAAERVGLLDLDAPTFGVSVDEQIPPDALVAIVEVREGDAVRRVITRAVEPNDPGYASNAVADVPLRTDVRLPMTEVSALREVLQRLATVEQALS
jgi:hypothetical protein